jgi:hypothetical protein
MKRTVHFKVRDEGTLVFIRPATKKAKVWIKENVRLNSWNWLGDGFAVEHRYADDILFGASEAVGGVYYE